MSEYLDNKSFFKYLLWSIIALLFILNVGPELYDAVKPQPFRFEAFKTEKEILEFLKGRYIGKNINEVMPELEKVGVLDMHRSSEPTGHGRSDLSAYERSIPNYKDYEDIYEGSCYMYYMHNWFRGNPLTSYTIELFFDAQDRIFAVAVLENAKNFYCRYFV
ncbi:hypothetical protein Cyrtocomes_00847 [Candidatus Cyrtobacter comes]|uniref:Uncharacterized protein n=1 Tax=Candidatus Cyrtobacter comes TaxID=675776 RepID=A0ABU5L8M3_9RICK|nr:hypothetical protein [Candidatus Cyrtobacter comes]MDZ5762463.1 hypothetical protein [Candidatus Cyrtobacter comes]